MSNSNGNGNQSNVDQSGWVDPLEAARRTRVAVAGDITASAGSEVHGDNLHGVTKAKPSSSHR